MQKNNYSHLILSFLVSVSLSSYSFAEDPAVTESAPNAAPMVGGGELIPHDEVIGVRMGRVGEAEEEIPEDFKFNKAEEKLWLSDHLGNIEKPISLYYEFVKSGTYEEGFSDSIYLRILEINEDGTKNAHMDFFTADRKQAVSPDNVTGITGNPVVGIYMQGDVYEMNRLTDGHWRHFQKSIKISLRKDAKVEPATFIYDGKEYKGEKISFTPFVNDPHRRDFEKFADKYYEFLFSDDIPGSLYQIKTIIPNTSKENAEPLILETLTLIEIKINQS